MQLTSNQLTESKPVHQLDIGSLRAAVQVLANAVDVVSSLKFAAVDLRWRDTLVGGVVQHFEFTFELCWKMLNRQVERELPSPSELDRSSFRDLFRLGHQRGLVTSVEPWFEFRELRNITAHTGGWLSLLKLAQRRPHRSPAPTKTRRSITIASSCTVTTLKYHPHRSTLERTRLVMPENDLDYELLRQITDQPTASQRGLAARLGVSVGKINYCLRALVDKGWVKANNFRRSDNKLAYAYLLTPRGASAKVQLAHDFLARKEREFDCLQREIAELRSAIADSHHNA